MDVFKQFYPLTLSNTVRKANSIPGAFNYEICNESLAIVRNNELYTSIEFETDDIPFESFEVIQFRNIWTLVREYPYNENQWKLQQYTTEEELRFPDIALTDPVAFQDIYPMIIGLSVTVTSVVSLMIYAVYSLCRCNQNRCTWKQRKFSKVEIIDYSSDEQQDKTPNLV